MTLVRLRSIDSRDNCDRFLIISALARRAFPRCNRENRELDVIGSIESERIHRYPSNSRCIFTSRRYQATNEQPSVMIRVETLVLSRNLLDLVTSSGVQRVAVTLTARDCERKMGCCAASISERRIDRSRSAPAPSRVPIGPRHQPTGKWRHYQRGIEAVISREFLRHAEITDIACP